MEERKLFSVVAQGRLRVQMKGEEGHEALTHLGVQIVLARFNSVEEAVTFFNGLSTLSFDCFAQPAIIAQTTEH